MGMNGIQGMGMRPHLPPRTVGGRASQVQPTLFSGCVLHSREEETIGEHLSSLWRSVGQAAALWGAVGGVGRGRGNSISGVSGCDNYM